MVYYYKNRKYYVFQCLLHEYVDSYIEIHLVLIKLLSLPPEIFKVFADLDNKSWQICDILKNLITELQSVKIFVIVL